MRFMIVSILAFFSSLAMAHASGSGFEGNYKVERVTETTGVWSEFWGRPDINHLSEVVLEDSGNHLYIGLTDAKGLTWSANYGVCTGQGEYCNAKISADGQSIEIEFYNWTDHFVITLGKTQGRMVYTNDTSTSTLVFEHSKN